MTIYKGCRNFISSNAITLSTITVLTVLTFSTVTSIVRQSNNFSSFYIMWFLFLKRKDCTFGLLLVNKYL